MNHLEEARKLDRAKALGPFGGLYVQVAKILEEAGGLLKLVSAAHRMGSAPDAYFDSELGDLAFQLDLLCELRGKNLVDFVEDGRTRFEERILLKEKW